MLTNENTREDPSVIKDDDNDILVIDGINSLIHNIFTPMDDDMICDNLFIYLANKPLYEG